MTVVGRLPVEIDRAGGFAITLSDQPYPEIERLYSINLGGYDRGGFTETHRNKFVAPTAWPRLSAAGSVGGSASDPAHRSLGEDYLFAELPPHRALWIFRGMDVHVIVGWARGDGGQCFRRSGGAALR